jgi:hypothetical protein
MKLLCWYEIESEIRRTPKVGLRSVREHRRNTSAWC